MSVSFIDEYGVHFTVGPLPVPFLCKFLVRFLFVLFYLLLMGICFTQNRIFYSNDLLSPSGVTYRKKVLMCNNILSVKLVNGLEIMII